MATFIVICHACEQKLLRKAKREKREVQPREFEEGVLFETAHAIMATDAQVAEAMVCPRCDGSNCEKTFLGYSVVSYIRGNGYLDKVGVKRDMNLFKLSEDDPYAEYRVPGEVDDMKAGIKKAGQHQPRRQHFDARPKGMRKAVEEAVMSPDAVAPPPSIPG